MSKNIFLGYSQNDFLYAKATQFENVVDPLLPESEKTFSNSLPFPITNKKCAVGFNDRNTLIMDISNNLQFYIQNLDLGSIAAASEIAGQQRILKQLKQMKLTIVAKNGYINETANYNFVGSGSIDTRLDAFGRPDSSLNLTFTMPRQQLIQTAAGPRYVSITTGNPKCYYNDNCVKKHNHYPKCTTQTYKNPDGTTYCKCVCTGTPVYDDTPHSHCEEQNTPNDVDDNPHTSMQKAAASISNVKLSFDPNFKSIKNTTKTDANYSTGEFIVTPDIKADEIIELIADYYIALCDNKKKALKLGSLRLKNLSAGQLYTDANIAYSRQYQNMINISLSVLAVGGAFYYVVKYPPE